MLDSDLARLYECKNGTKVINQAVNRNAIRFPIDFYFQLTKEEYNNLKSQIVTSNMNGNLDGDNNLRSQIVTTNLTSMTRTLPYVFTEQGVAMLASVLRTEVAAEVSVAIMRAFVIMKKYINNSLIEQKYINNMVLDNNEQIKEIRNDVKLLQESFNKFEEKAKINEIYFNGQIYDAYSKVQEIFSQAKNNLIIIDTYADITVLDIIKRLNIDVVIITRKDNLLTNQDIIKYNKQYHNLKVIYDNSYHDRYFIMDNKIVYHCGTSINRIGYKTFSITLVNDNDICNLLINKVNKIILKV